MQPYAYRTVIVVHDGHLACIARFGEGHGGTLTQLDSRSDEKTISPDDMRDRLIHSMQVQVEVDEPEAEAAPMRPQELRPMLGRDDPTIDTIVDTMTEEALLRGLERLLPEDPSKIV
jgi:hypothetical protein